MTIKEEKTMFKLFGDTQVTEIYCDSFEAGCIGRALEDLEKDIYKISGRKVNVKRYLPDGNTSCMIIGTVTNERFAHFLQKKGIDVSEIEGKWEHYILQTIDSENPCFLICGSDKRGAMWGIYEFCEKFLQVDPLYLWTDHEPEKRNQIILGKTAITGGPKTYRFRGWFINDEDLLTGWSRKAVPEKGYSFYQDYPPVLEQILETALRLKQNLIIPCSHLDLEDPAQENIVRMVTERGLYISQHHQEPVGVLQTTIDRYWEERGAGTPPSYVESPEKYEEVWAHYIHKWAQYEDVIWQLGLRGRGDRPLWYQNGGIPDSMEARGRIISSAISAQAEIVKKEYQGRKFLSSSTLWMEGMKLYKEGNLTFPEDTIVVFADFGPDQMWGEGYYTAERQENRECGVYYHAGFWGCGPHMVQGNSPDKIYFNYKDAVEKGDRCYSILNVANIREFVQSIRCVAEITWDIGSFSVEEFLSRWCRKEFKLCHTDKAAAVYKNYFRSFHEIDRTLIEGQMLFMDGMSRRVALKMIQIINGSEFKPEDIQNKKLFDFSSGEDFIAYYKAAAGEGIKRWKRLYGEAFDVLNTIEKERQPFFIDNLIVQVEIMFGLYSWVYYLALAAEARLEGKDTCIFDNWIQEAVFALEKTVIDRRKAQHGKWQHWYDGDQLMDLERNIEITASLLSRQGEGREEQPFEVNILNSIF